jgi:hypothetical protein
MRKLLFIILVSALAGGGIWYFFVRDAAPGAGEPTGVGNFFPTNNTGMIPDTIAPNDVGASGSAGVIASNDVPKLAQLTSGPVAGYTVFSTTRPVTTTSTDPKQKPVTTTVTDRFLRYVSRANGYVYEVKNTDAPLQITNISIPNIYEATFADSNKSVILRFLRADNRTIASYSVPIPPENTDGTRTQAAGSYLPDNMLSVAVSPDRKTIARLFNTQGNGVIQTSTPTNTGVKELLRSPFREWLLSWPTKGAVYAQTKASANVPGYLYSINTTNPRLTRVLGDIRGLTTSVSPSGSFVLYSESAGNSFSASLYNTKTGTTTPLNLSILPEKCVWTAAENLICAGNESVSPARYPDSWYAGVVHFTDKIYAITVATNTYETLYDGTTRPLDITHPTLDESQTLLYFIDKNDGTLWRYDY